MSLRIIVKLSIIGGNCKDSKIRWSICWGIRETAIKRTKWSVHFLSMLSAETISYKILIKRTLLLKQIIFAFRKFNKLIITSYKDKTSILQKVVFWKSQLMVINNKEEIKISKKVISKNPRLWVGMCLLLWFRWLGRGGKELMAKMIEFELSQEQLKKIF